MSTEKTYGIITRGVGGLYDVRTPDNPQKEILCRARGILRREKLTPTVGDDVLIESAAPGDEYLEPDDEENGRHAHTDKKKNGVKVDYVIDTILPRNSLLIRPPMANLDYLFAVIPAALPEPDLLTADKLTVIAENYGIEPVIVVNKADLALEYSRELCSIYERAGYRVFLVSCADGSGIAELSEFLTGLAVGNNGERHISGAFAGVSGAGKSTLMTALFPKLSLTTGEVSRKTERGRHTTRRVELYPIEMNGSTFWLADTPGFSMLDFTRFDFFPYDELACSFREFNDCLGRCRYTKCTHLREEGCAVIEKLGRGEIAKSRHESYVKIFGEQRSVPEWKRK